MYLEGVYENMGLQISIQGLLNEQSLLKIGKFQNLILNS